MALIKVRIGSFPDMQYDDADFDKAISTDAPIKAGPPVDPTDVIRVTDAPGAGAEGDVVGPAAATDEAIARYDGATGKLLQNSLMTIDNSGTTNIPTGQGYKVNNIQVVTDQQVAEADVAAVSAIAAGAGADTIDLATFNTDLTTLVTEINAIKTKLNNLLAKLRTHGLIDT